MIQHLLNEALAEIRVRLSGAAPFSLMLDFDGTLVPLVHDAGTSRLDIPVRQALLSLMRTGRVAVAVISGRSLEDLSSRIAIDGVIYAGNHGLEITGGQFGFIDPVASDARFELRQLSALLIAKFGSMCGVQVEYKVLTTTVHYRAAFAWEEELVRTTLEQVSAPYSSRLRIRAGKKCFDITPRTDWNKGSAALWINRHLGVSTRDTVYIGDDRTDEDAFSVLSAGITVKVGEPTNTCARYWLREPAEVQSFLSWLTAVPFRSFDVHYEGN